MDLETQKDYGQDMYSLCERLFPICRSITGDGVRETLSIIKEEVPEMVIYEVPSGTSVFDWTVPKEWRIRGAYIDKLNEDGSTIRILDFTDTNLYVVGYSVPVDKIISLEELLPLIYVEESDAEAIPYVTSYYKERFGFCMSRNQKDALTEGNYHIVIDSELFDGSLTYGEVILPGKTEKEVFFSTYVCHPSMANNEISGPCVVTELIKYVRSMSDRKYTYRFIYIPETIGSITYLSTHYKDMKRNVIAGFNVSCVGDDRTYSYIESRYGNTLADKVAKNVLGGVFPNYKHYTFLDRGSDERQYNAPGIDLPVCAICRSKYGEYPEYHTSKDDLNLISEEGLQGAYEVYRRCIDVLEWNEKYKVTCLCEPQLGKRGLYPTISQKGNYDDVEDMMNLIAYADGINDLIQISDIIGVPVTKLISYVKMLLDAGLLADAGLK